MNRVLVGVMRTVACDIRHRLTTAVVVALAFGVLSCDASVMGATWVRTGVAIEAGSRRHAPTTPKHGPLSREPRVRPQSGPPPHQLVVKEVVTGTGLEAKRGDSITVNYVGALYNGKIFDTSWKRKEPFTFRLGAGEVIVGWEKGFRGMRVGGRRELIIPAREAYGRRGSPPTIPPNATLVFIVDLLGA